MSSSDIIFVSEHYNFGPRKKVTTIDLTGDVEEEIPPKRPYRVTYREDKEKKEVQLLWNNFIRTAKNRLRNYRLQARARLFLEENSRGQTLSGRGDQKFKTEAGSESPRRDESCSALVETGSKNAKEDSDVEFPQISAALAAKALEALRLDEIPSDDGIQNFVAEDVQSLEVPQIEAQFAPFGPELSSADAHAESDTVIEATPAVEKLTNCIRRLPTREAKVVCFEALAKSRKEFEEKKKRLEKKRKDLELRYEQMLNEEEKATTIGKSRIHGLGLFAARDYRKKDLVVEYSGELITREEADIREEKYLQAGTLNYLMSFIDLDIVIDATVRGGRAKLVNHSCEPNLTSVEYKIYGKHQVIFQAIKNIKKGEEFTVNFLFQPSEKKELPCLCNAENCKGWLD